MDKARKKRYEFKYEGYDKTTAYNVYLFRADAVFYFGMEDINEGASLSESFIKVCQHLVDQYKMDPENVFFYKWYTRYKNRGVEQIEFEWNESKLETPTIKKYCEYKENPFH